MNRPADLKAIINASLRDRIMLLIVAAIIGIVGYFSYQTAPLDAIPDLSDVQMIVFTK